MAIRRVSPITYEGNVMVINPCADEANDDWVRSGRLKEAAEKGDQAAADELAKLAATDMVEEVEDDEED
jgi:hypothetical protein